MKIFLTGATGFTGSYVLELLLARGHRPRCLYRSPARIASLPRSGVEWVQGDLGDPAGLAQWMDGCDTLLNTASLGFGHAPGLVRAARQAGIRRAVFLSTTAIFTRLNPASKAVRLAAEETIRASGLEWTVLRPTMIYGSKRDRNLIRLIRWLRLCPLFPVFGAGRHLMQPVYVGDVARAALAALENPATIGQAYNIAGLSPLPYNQLIDTVAAALGRPVWKVHLPLIPALRILQGCEKLGLRLPLKAEQLERLNEDKAFDIAPAVRDFHYSPLPFTAGIAQEIKQL